MPLPENLLVCRLCLKNGSFADIFEVNGTLKIRVADVINELLELNVSPGDGLPNVICCDCLNELARFKRFKSISYEAKATLECIIKENFDVLPNSVSLNTSEEDKVVEIVDLVEDDDSEDESSGAETVAAPSPSFNEGESNMDQEDDDCEIVCMPSVNTSNDAKETSFSSTCRNNQSSSSKTTAVYLPVAKELVRKEEEDAGMVVAKDPLSIDEDEFPSGNGRKSDDGNPIDVRHALIKSELMESEIEDPLALPSSSKTTTVYLPEAKELIKNDDNAKIGRTKDPLNVEGDNVSSESDFESDDESIVNIDSDDEADVVELDIEDSLDGSDEPEHCSRTLGYVRSSKIATINASSSSNQPMQADKNEVEDPCHNFRSSTVSLSESGDEEASGCEDNVLQCSKCAKTFDNDLEFQAHVENVTCQIIQCVDCLKNFSSKANLRKHKKECQMSKIYLCNVCKKIFKDALSLRGHVMNHSKTSNFYTCNKCNTKFTRKRKFEKHKKQCSVPETVSSEKNSFYYRCGLCKNSYKAYAGFRKHFLGHTGKVAAICVICNMSFKCGVDLKRHVSDEHGVLECNFCSKKFMESYYLNRHILTHTGERSFYCNLCGNNYKTQYTLDVHLLSAHKG